MVHTLSSTASQRVHWVGQLLAREQNKLDTGRATEGRSIGHVRDKSAPTVWSDYFVRLHNRWWAR